MPTKPPLFRPRNSPDAPAIPAENPQNLTYLPDKMIYQRTTRAKRWNFQPRPLFSISLPTTSRYIISTHSIGEVLIGNICLHPP
jgi:hypothetical protein